MPDLSTLDNATKVVIDYAVRSFARKVLANPRLDEDPTPVIANERDRLLDEMWNIPATPLELPKKIWAPEKKEKTNGHAHRNGARR